MSEIVRRCGWLLVLLTRVVTGASGVPEQQAGEVRVDERAYGYRLLVPEVIEEGRHYPLMLFLHGAGERGDDNDAQLTHFPERMESVDNRRRYPCFVLSPQCPTEARWSSGTRDLGMGGAIDVPPSPPMRAAIAALQEVIATHPVDLDRVYLTGLSMGGGGTWELAARYPGWFAAAVPICGGADVESASRLSGLPLSVWHGADDGVVPPDRSRRMTDAVRAAGGSPTYHLLPGVGHDSWVAAYGADGCLEWLFAQRRNPDAERRAAARGLARVCGPDERIAFLGDSITQGGNDPGGYVDQLRTVLADERPGVRVIPAGISGHKVPDLLRRYERDVIDEDATVVFLYIGINDVWHSESGRGTPADAYEAGLRTIIRRLHATGATVVLATPSVIGERPLGDNRLDAMLVEYAAISRRVADDEDVVLCDLQRAFDDDLAIFNTAGKTRGVLTTDGVHLNDAGNTFVATQAARALTEALERRAARE